MKKRCELHRRDLASRGMRISSTSEDSDGLMNLLDLILFKLGLGW
jgi:hypothetical protein